MTSKRPEPRLPEGFGYLVRLLLLDDVEAVHALLAQSAEESEAVPPTCESIRRTMERLGDHLQTGGLVVLSGEEPVAAALVFLPPSSGDEAIGVVPEWRGRGVADAIMSRSLTCFLEDGLSQAALDVDAQSLTGALQLYEKHGFTPSKSTVTFEKSLG